MHEDIVVFTDRMAVYRTVCLSYDKKLLPPNENRIRCTE